MIHTCQGLDFTNDSLVSWRINRGKSNLFNSVKSTVKLVSCLEHGTKPAFAEASNFDEILQIPGMFREEKLVKRSELFVFFS
jgi:hypothetical protein